MNKQPTSRMCFVCGVSNPAGVHVRFYSLPDGSVEARFVAGEQHQGFPGRMHGGVITAVLDETIGRAIMSKHGETIWAVTVELSVRFRQPVPLGVELRASGTVAEENRRIFSGRSELLLPDGTVAAEATGKYLRMALAQIADIDPHSERWEVAPDRPPADPQEDLASG